MIADRFRLAVCVFFVTAWCIAATNQDRKVSRDDLSARVEARQKLLNFSLDEGEWSDALLHINFIEFELRQAGLPTESYVRLRAEALLGLKQTSEAIAVLNQLDESSFGGAKLTKDLAYALAGQLGVDVATDNLEGVLKKHRIAITFMGAVKTKSDVVIAVRLARAEKYSGGWAKRAIRESREVLLKSKDHPLAAYYIARNLNDLKESPEEERRMWFLASKLPGPLGVEARRFVSYYERVDQKERGSGQPHHGQDEV